ncbi:MAG: putative Ig domain-containing protein, partial [Woeseia sp.]
MYPKPIARPVQRCAVVLSALLAMTGCLPSGEADQATDNGNSSGEITSSHRISGSVGDGPVTNAEIRVIASDGTSLGVVMSDANADFDVEVSTVASDYPLSLLGLGGTDLVTLTSPDFDLKSMVRSSTTASVANLNPFTTIAFEAATDMSGGVNATNMDNALRTVHLKLNSGLSTLGNSTTMEAAFDESNVAEIVRASETLGEAVRRTRDALVASGHSANGNSVVVSVGSDLIDGVLDGRGGSRADNRISAVFAVALAQVSLESGRNQLRVFGSDAMGRIQDAITQVFDGTPNPGLADLPLTSGMLESMRIGLMVAEVMQPTAAIATLRNEVAELRPLMNGAQVRAALSGSAQADIEAGLIAIAGASASELDAINLILRTGNVPSDNSAPVISGQPQTRIGAGTAYNFEPTAIDSDGDTLTFSISGRPTWANFDNSTGRLSGTPAQSDIGSTPGVSISVSDGEAISSLPAFTITVEAGVSNSAPTISGTPSSSLVVGNTYNFTPNAADADGDALTFSVNNLPVWASFNAQSGRLTGTPSDSDVGSYSGIAITASDGTASASLAAFSITVEEATVPNRAPQISGNPATTVQAGSAYTFQPTASDADGDALTFSISGRPAWASFSPSTGALAGTPGEGDAGNYAGITISVSDGEFTASLPGFSITVEAAPANNAPLISGSPAATIQAGSSYNFRPTASDADGDALTFSINGRPSWASFNQSTGALTGTPSAGNAGNYAGIAISVSDGEATVSLPSFAITVEAVAENNAPVISGSPAAAVLVDASFSFQPTASDADGDSLTFSVSGAPGWASFNTSNGRLSGTPSAADVGVYSGIRITVSDGEDSATLGPFTIAVNAITLGSATLNWSAPSLNTDGTPLVD